MAKSKRYVNVAYPVGGLEWIDDLGTNDEDGILFTTMRNEDATNRSLVNNKQRLIKWSNLKKAIGNQALEEYGRAVNIGPIGSIGIFSDKSETEYRFKSLVQGDGMSLVDQGDSIVVSISSFAEGLQLPALFQSERDLITSPVPGALIFNKDSKELNWYSGTAWKSTNE